MIRFLNMDEFTKKLKPVTTTEYFTRAGEFHVGGLFSESIFGITDKERRSTFSYIDLHAKIIHPEALKILIRLNGKIVKFISTEKNFSLDASGALVEDENGVTGIAAFIKMFPKIKFREETTDRTKLNKVIQNAYKTGTLFLSRLPVIPPEHRPAYKDEDDQWTIDTMNDVYMDIMRKALQVRSASGSGPLFDILNYSLQTAIVEHHKYIHTKVAKKQGIIRSQLLSKRVDFSGRAVITPGPDLKVNEIGVPFRMAVGLFEPFILHQLLYAGRIDKEMLSNEIKAFNELELSVDSVRKVLKAIKSGDKIPDTLYKIFYEATEVAMMDRVVLAKRDPALQAESVRAYKPVLITGNTIQMCTMQVGGHNADFDGDAMALYHPLTDEAQEEAKAKMLRAESGSSSTAITFSLSKEMMVGLYSITKDVKPKNSPKEVSPEDLEKATDPYIAVKFRGVNTTMGKALFNSCLPRNYPFVNQRATKKVANSIISKMVDTYGGEIARESISRMEKLGFKFATIMGSSITLDDFEVPAKVYQLKKQLKGKDTDEAMAILEQMYTIVKKKLEDSGLYDLTESGSTKGWGQPMQILVAKGIIADSEGNILPVISASFADGLSPTEYFNSSTGARKGIIDRVINTATTGYMSRKLAFVLNNLEAHTHLRDCGTKKTVSLKLTKDIISRLSGRFHIYRGKVTEFDPEKFKPGDVIQLRSPIYCRSRKLCLTCYGRLLQRHRTPYVGVLAAQVIGEKGTQLIMRTFHTGGAVTIKQKDMLQDIINNDPIADLDMSTLKKYIVQEGGSLVCKKGCELLIDLMDYTESKNIEIKEDSIWLSGLSSRIEFEDKMFNMVLDYPVDIKKQEFELIKKKSINCRYIPGSVILEIPLEALELKEQALYVERLLAGKEVFKSVDHLILKLVRVYAEIGADMDMVHLECLLSNCIRDKNNLSIPARLGNTWDPVLVNIKKVVFSSGFLQGLAFENIGEAIRNGLISEEEVEPSILEKVLTGTLVEEKK